MSLPCLEIKNLSCRYPGASEYALKELNCSLYPSEFLLVAGASGCGKSTFLHVVNGLIPQTVRAEVAGELLLHGEPLQNNAAERSLQIGSVLQNADEQIIYDRVEDELAFPLENLGVAAEEIAERIQSAAGLVGLQLSWPTATLSGGQKQRLITAASLGMKQKIFLMDEPLANLDVPAARALLKLLQKLVREEGYSVIFIEHRLDLVLPYADRVLYLDDDGHQSFSDVSEFVRAKSSALGQGSGQNVYAFQNLRTEHSDLATTTQQPSLISLQDCSLVLGGRTILRNLNFNLREGEHWIITGDNGSGKTSFLKLLCGLQKPTSGQCRTAWPVRDSFQHVGVVMQNPDYQLFMPTVEQELRFREHDPELTEQLIAILGLENLRTRHPHSLSEGQKRKIGVAAILAAAPDVLIMDEPSVGQDDESLRRLIAAIAHVDSLKPMSSVTVTHDKRCAARFGNKELRLEAPE